MNNNLIKLNEKQLFLTKFPYLIEIKCNSNQFYGLFRGGGGGSGGRDRKQKEFEPLLLTTTTKCNIQSYRIHLNVPEFPKLIGYHLEIIKGLTKFTDIIKNDGMLKNNCENVFELLELIEKQLNAAGDNQSTKSDKVVDHSITSDEVQMEFNKNKFNFLKQSRLLKHLKELNENNPVYKISISTNHDEDYPSSSSSIVRITNFPNYENHFIELKQCTNTNINRNINEKMKKKNENNNNIDEGDSKKDYHLAVARNNDCDNDDEDLDDDFQVIKHSLPEIGTVHHPMFNDKTTIETHLMKFQMYLEQMMEFYCNMEKIDDLCFVVDPIPPVSTKSTTRIFKLDDKVFLKIVLDPMLISSFNIYIIGPSLRIEPLREQLERNIMKWNADLDVYNNLLKMFDLIYFPTKSISIVDDHHHHRNGIATTTTKMIMTTDNSEPHQSESASSDNNIHCNICFSYRSPQSNQIPLISCDNENCNVIYHTDCLKDWFIKLKDSKTFINITLGTCPFCEMKLSTSFSHLLEM